MISFSPKMADRCITLRSLPLTASNYKLSY